jgi:hypothetical protein
MEFEKNSAFSTKESRYISSMRHDLTPGPERPDPGVVQIPREQVENWYNELNDLYSSSVSRTAASRERIADVRDEIYQWLAG